MSATGLLSSAQEGFFFNFLVVEIESQWQFIAYLVNVLIGNREDWESTFFRDDELVRVCEGGPGRVGGISQKTAAEHQIVLVQ